MMTSNEKYRNDPMFHNLVDMMVSYLMQSNFTPSEMREAAMFASVRYEQMHPVMRFVPNEVTEKAFGVLRKYSTLKDGEPCGHPGCLHHMTHPCEGCGRIGGRT